QRGLLRLRAPRSGWLRQRHALAPGSTMGRGARSVHPRLERSTRHCGAARSRARVRPLGVSPFVRRLWLGSSASGQRRRNAAPGQLSHSSNVGPARIAFGPAEMDRPRGGHSVIYVSLVSAAAIVIGYGLFATAEPSVCAIATTGPEALE